MLELHAAGREILGRPRDMARPYGLFVKKNGFQGWQGLSSVRREALARAVEHGEYDVPVYLGSRVMTIDGWAIAPTEPELRHLSESLTGLLSGIRERWKVKHQGSYRWADGRVILATADDTATRASYGYRAEFQLQVVFADPRRYADTQVFPLVGTARSMQVSHRGNFAAFPVIEIPAAPSSYSVSSPGGTFTVSGATPGGTHSIDLRRGRVHRDGVEMYDVGVGDLWVVPPGERWLHTLSVPGVVRVLDTYV